GKTLAGRQRLEHFGFEERTGGPAVVGQVAGWKEGGVGNSRIDPVEPLRGERVRLDLFGEPAELGVTESVAAIAVGLVVNPLGSANLLDLGEAGDRFELATDNARRYAEGFEVTGDRVDVLVLCVDDEAGAKCRDRAERAEVGCGGPPASAPGGEGIE